MHHMCAIFHHYLLVSTLPASKPSHGLSIARAFLYLQEHDSNKIIAEVNHPTLGDDGFASSNRHQARAGIIHALQAVDFRGKEPVVRIKMVDTADLALRDVKAILTLILTMPSALSLTMFVTLLT